MNKNYKTNGEKSDTCGLNNHKTSNCNYKGNMNEEFPCNYCKKPWHTESKCFKKIDYEKEKMKVVRLLRQKTKKFVKQLMELHVYQHVSMSRKVKMKLVSQINLGYLTQDIPIT